MATGLIKRFYEEVLEGGHLGLIDELASEDVEDHEEGIPGQPAGREGVKFFVSAMRSAFPDIRVEMVEPMLAEGTLEAARAVISGTHDGELLGVPPTGNKVTFETLDIIRVEDGRCVEHWGVTDTMAIMQQIGAVPASA